MGKRSNTKEFIEKSQQKHGDRYDYSNVAYTKSCDKVTIICPEHGEWEQRPNDHLMGCGCPGCKFDKIADQKRSNVLDFVAKAIVIHGPVYDYSRVQYTNAITKVNIICEEHGIFRITPDKHLSGGGCQKCSNGISRGEKKIQMFLDEHGIIYEREKRFHKLYGATKNSRLRYDFFLPDYNILMEYDGEHHFRPVRTKGRLTQTEANKKHKVTKINDKKKNDYAEKNGYTLLRIKYTEYDVIESTLTDLLL